MQIISLTAIVTLALLVTVSAKPVPDAVAARTPFKPDETHIAVKARAPFKPEETHIAVKLRATPEKRESDTELNPTKMSGDGAHNTASNSNYSGGTQVGNDLLNGASSNSLNGVAAKPDSKVTSSSTTPSDSTTTPETTPGSGGDTIKVNPTTVSGNDGSNSVDNTNYSGGHQVANNIGNGLLSNTGNKLASK